MHKIILSFCAFFILFRGEACAHPSGALLLIKFPAHMVKYWKEINRQGSEDLEITDMIPATQTADNCSEMLQVRTYKIVRNEDTPFADFLGLGLEEFLSKYPKEDVTFRVIEMQTDSAIFESILHRPYKERPIQHEVARFFLTHDRFHYIVYRQLYREMSPEARDEWVTILRDKVSLVPRFFEDPLTKEERMKECPLNTAFNVGRNGYVIGYYFGTTCCALDAIRRNLEPYRERKQVLNTYQAGDFWSSASPKGAAYVMNYVNTPLNYYGRDNIDACRVAKDSCDDFLRGKK